MARALLIAACVFVLALTESPIALAEPMPGGLKAYLRDFGGAKFARTAEQAWNLAPYRERTLRYMWAYGFAFFDHASMRSPMRESCVYYLANRSEFESSLGVQVAPVMKRQLAAFKSLFGEPNLKLSVNTILATMFKGLRYRCRMAVGG